LDRLHPNACDGALSRDGVEYLVAKHVAKAQRSSPFPIQKRVTPHVLRHTAAMELLQHAAITP
jgi:integrase/recombinase XerD